VEGKNPLISPNPLFLPIFLFFFFFFSTAKTRIHPQYHIFGHIHEGYGVTTDGHTKFINASTCTLRYKPVNPPIVFDIPIPVQKN
jgi:hypothetical protein